MRVLVFIIYIFCSNELVVAQNISKNRFVVEYLNGCKFEYYLTDKMLNGVYKEYYKNGVLFRLLEYKNDTLTGCSYYFDESGRLTLIERNIHSNDNEIFTADSSKKKPVYISHIYNYYTNGIVRSEGLILYDMSPIFESIEYGIWHFYKDDGTLDKIVDYKNRALLDGN